jgi:quercetin dioxygenase-like cupin family protein
MGKKENFSDNMKKLRTKKRVSLAKLAKETGYDEHYLSQIENNEVLAPVSVILSVSQALSIASEDFLQNREEKKDRRKVIKQRREGLKKRTDNYSYQVLTPQGSKKHLNAFKVTIEPQQEHKMVEYHHPGEEFIYVLSGTLKLKIGRNTYSLKQNENMHFDSTKVHKLWNTSKKPAVILVATYSP